MTTLEEQLVCSYCGTVYKLSNSRAICPECGAKRTPETKTLEEYKINLDAKSGTEIIIGETQSSTQYGTQKERRTTPSTTVQTSEQSSGKIDAIEWDVKKILGNIFLNYRHVFCNDLSDKYLLEHILLSESHGSISYFEMILNKIQQLWSTRFELIGEKPY